MDSTAITTVKARWILDSRGNPTVEATVNTATTSGTAMVPSGASTGTREAVELRDCTSAFHGNGVTQALTNITTIIAPAITGMDVTGQGALDQTMIALDGTSNKSKLGANAILAVSLACARAAAAAVGKPLYAYLGDERVLPVPFMNVINGGEHAGNDLAIQEHMIAPISARSMHEAVQMCSEVYHTLKTMLARVYGSHGTNVGDEGGFAPPMQTTEEALDTIVQAIEEHGYQRDISLALDAAASSFYANGTYQVAAAMSTGELLDYYVELARTYPIVSIEDPFNEDDWDGFIALTQKLGDAIQVVGDDLFVTTTALVEKGIAQGACNALLLKPNQIGTLTESRTVAGLCKQHGYGIMVSHRSGDTCDSFIADLAVALGTGQIKSGAPCRSERTTKYNRLLAIEDDNLATIRYGNRGKNRVL